MEQQGSPAISHSPANLSHTNSVRLPATCDPPSESNPPEEKIWVVFGATGHMGRSLLRTIIGHDDKVTAVGWTQEHTVQQMEAWQSPKSLGLVCDVRVRETVQKVFDKSVEHWGRVDIVVNCTGYGVLGACEDQSPYDLRAQFDTNFMGTLNIIHASLPYFRQRTLGRYLIFSSTSGALGVPGLGPYCATKYAVEGLIESMLYEIDCFNIKATLVEPGHVRLEDIDIAAILNPSSNSSLHNAPKAPKAQSASDGKPKKYNMFQVKKASPPYAGPTAPAGHAKRMVQWLNDHQPVSSVKSAELVWQLGHCSYPPLRMLLGSYAVESIRDRLKSIIEEIEDWKHLRFPVSDDMQSDLNDEGDGMRDEDQLMEGNT